MKIIKRIITIALSFMLGFVAGFITAKTNQFENIPPQVESGMETLIPTISPSWGSGLTIKASAAESATSSTNVIRLTATATPTIDTIKVDWSIAWADTSSTWVNGKTVTDYVTITPTSDGALTADVECLQPFSAQILVTVTVRTDSTLSASCTVDYYKRFESVSTVMKGESMAVMDEGSLFVAFADSNESLTGPVWQNKDINFISGVNFNSNGSLANAFYGCSWVVEYTDSFKSALQSDFPGIQWTFGQISYGGSLTKTYSQFEVVTTLATQDTYLGMYAEQLMSAFAREGNEIKVTLTSMSCKYGSPVAFTYYIDVGVN